MDIRWVASAHISVFSFQKSEIWISLLLSLKKEREKKVNDKFS